MLLIILAAILPGAALLAILAWRGRPMRYMLACLALGAVACLPAAGLEMFLQLKPWEMSNLGVLLAFAFIVAGAVEETCKLAVWYLGPGRWKEAHTDEYDSIVYAACIGLGFATAENIMYCWTGGMDTALRRAFTAVPAHAVFGVILGAWLGLARQRARVKWGTGQLVLGGLLLAIAAHGSYDTLAFQGSTVAIWLLFATLAAGVVWSVILARSARSRSPYYGGKALDFPVPLGPSTFSEVEQPGREPWIAALLGLIPGAGQLYNRQRFKALLFVCCAVFNVLLYAMARRFSDDPLGALESLAGMGMLPNLTKLDVKSAIEQRFLLPQIFAWALGIGSALGALDAWLCARTPRGWRSFASHGVLLTYVAHVVVALLFAFVPFFLPDAKGSPPPEGGNTTPNVSMKLTWIERVDGWKPPGQTAAESAPKSKVKAAPPKGAPTPTRPRTAPKPAVPPPPHVVYRQPPRPQPVVLTRKVPKAPKAIPTTDVPVPTVAVAPPAEKRPARAETRHAPPVARPAATPTAAPHDAPEAPPISSTVDTPDATDGDEAQPEGTPDAPHNGPSGGDGGRGVGIDKPGTGNRPSGQDGWFSYNQYLSQRFHEGHTSDVFFKHVNPETWVIVKYEILADGSLRGTQVVDTSGGPADTQRVLQMLNNCIPYRPLPPGVRRITVTELFWTQEFRKFPPRSLAESLSHLPDGRYIEED